MQDSSTISVETIDSGNLQVNTDFASLLSHNNIKSADDLWAVQSEAVKTAVPTRGTSRAYLKDPFGGSDIEVYIKRYLKPSARDRFKCAVSLKPVFSDGALHEWDALCRFHALGLKTMIPIAAADCGQRRTCNLTLGITGYIRASDLFADRSLTDPARRQNIIKKFGKLLGMMHASGLAHQDFYLVHLFIKSSEDDAVYLIDLQRTIMQRKLAKRWRVKDLAQIMFSSDPFFSDAETSLFLDTYLQHAGETMDSGHLFRAAARKSRRIKKHSLKHNM